MRQTRRRGVVDFGTERTGGGTAGGREEDDGCGDNIFCAVSTDSSFEPILPHVERCRRRRWRWPTSMAAATTAALTAAAGWPGRLGSASLSRRRAVPREIQYARGEEGRSSIDPRTLFVVRRGSAGRGCGLPTRDLWATTGRTDGPGWMRRRVRRRLLLLLFLPPSRTASTEDGFRLACGGWVAEPPGGVPRDSSGRQPLRANMRMTRKDEGPIAMRGRRRLELLLAHGGSDGTL
jgi:hypothetical protein